MLQGDTNMPATAIRVIGYILQGFIGKFKWVYLNDISIYSGTLADHITHIHAVYLCLQEHKIITSLKKCNFVTKRLHFLEHYINEKGVYTDPAAIQVI
jgi:hypothetical protein